MRLEGAGVSKVLENAMSAIQADVVVMTQACDLEQEKIENVILCPHVDLDEHYITRERNRKNTG